MKQIEFPRSTPAWIMTTLRSVQAGVPRTHLYLTGGRLRELLHPKSSAYDGDWDFIVSGASRTQIVARCVQLHLEWSLHRKGGVRIYRTGHPSEYLDLMIADAHDPYAVLPLLSGFNLSVNAAALCLDGSGDVVEVPRRNEDLVTRTAFINLWTAIEESPRLLCRRACKYLRTALKLGLWRLSFAHPKAAFELFTDHRDLMWPQLTSIILTASRGRLQAQIQDLREKTCRDNFLADRNGLISDMVTASREVADLLGPDLFARHKAYVVRGVFGAMAGTSILPSDDIDVLTTAPRSLVLARLIAGAASWKLNYFGDFKILTSTGVAVDVFTPRALDDHMGTIIERNLATYAFEHESIAAELHSFSSGRLEPTIGRDLNSGVELSRWFENYAAPREAQYAALKAVALICRNGWRPGKRLVALWRSSPLFPARERRPIARMLASSLHEVGTPHWPEYMRFLVRRKTTGPYLSYALEELGIGV